MSESAPASGAEAAPPEFRAALDALLAVRPRPEISVAPARPPQRLAPYSHALTASVETDEHELATARLILLHDPDGQQAWHGTLRLVVYLRAEVEAELATDPLLPAVGWSWLRDALDGADARTTALGGTVTVTSSARFGDIAGPERTDDLELRASWTPLDGDLQAHGRALCALLADAAGLPPVGVAAIGSAARTGSGSGR